MDLFNFFNSAQASWSAPKPAPRKSLPMRCLLCRYFFSVWHVNLQLSTVLYIIQTIAGKNCIAHVNHLVETL